MSEDGMVEINVIRLSNEIKQITVPSRVLTVDGSESLLRTAKIGKLSQKTPIN